MQPLCSPFFFDYTHPPLNPTSSPAISWCRPKFPPPAPPLSGRRSPTITCNSSITCKHPPSSHVSGTHTPHAHPGFFRQRDEQRERDRGSTRKTRVREREEEHADVTPAAGNGDEADDATWR
ncbi:hypothetical protein HanPI659440_Chr12g0454321 [Helianthus annuus]|nr:hypothetical protein HanPI659440_Chr12g0454321 [Helianthus annuus]